MKNTILILLSLFLGAGLLMSCENHNFSESKPEHPEINKTKPQSKKIDYIEGKRLIESAIKLTPEGPKRDELKLISAQASMHIAYDSIIQEKFQLAISNLEEALPILKVQNRKDDTAQALLLMATAYRRIGSWREAKRFYDEALSFQETAFFQRNKATTLKSMALVSLHLGNLQEAKELVQQAKTTAQKNNNPHEIAEVLRTQGTLEVYQGHFKEAEQFYLQALHILKTHKDNAEEFGLLIDLGSTYLSQKDYPKAKKVFTESCKNTTSKDIQTECAYRFGLLYHSQGQFKEALSYYDQVKEHYKNSEYNISPTLKLIEKAKQNISIEPYSEIIRKPIH